MTDLSTTIVPKSDQMNSDDLISGPRTIRVAKVSLTGEEQPVAISYEGDGGKPFKPCKVMRRVLVALWGPDANNYVGRSMTLYRDPNVKFGGMAVGGIRISHLSHIEREQTMALTETRASRKPFTVKPLKDAPATPPGSPRTAAERSGGASQPQSAKAPRTLSERVDGAVAALEDCREKGPLDETWGKMSALRADAKADAGLERKLIEAYDNMLRAFAAAEPVADDEDAY